LTGAEIKVSRKREKKHRRKKKGIRVTILSFDGKSEEVTCGTEGRGRRLRFLKKKDENSRRPKKGGGKIGPGGRKE